MLTTFNAKALAQLYKMGYSTFQQYLAPHREQLRKCATKRICSRNKKPIIAQNYNSDQLRLITSEILGDSPEGYEFNGKTLVKMDQ